MSDKKTSLLDDEPTEPTEPEAPVEKASPVEKAAPAKSTKTEKTGRRTKAEKLADDIESAKVLLRENGYRVLSDAEDRETSAELESGAAKDPDEDLDFLDAVAEHGVISAMSGQVTGTIDMNAVSVPVLRVSVVNWVGTSPLELVASSGIKDLRKVLRELEKQAR